MESHENLSHSAAHYLMTLAELIRRNGYARAIDVAEEMRVSKVSAHLALKGLCERGLIMQDEKHFYRLPESSLRMARELIGTRDVTARFFTEVLKMDDLDAQVNACRIEHALSHGAAHSILSFLRFASETPSGKKLLKEFANFRKICGENEFQCSRCSVKTTCSLHCPVSA